MKHWARHKSLWIASLLSLIVPGLGQVYNHQILKGLAFGVGAPLVVLAGLSSAIPRTFEGFATVMALGLVIRAAIVFDAFRVARKPAENTGTSWRVPLAWRTVAIIGLVAVYVGAEVLADSLRETLATYRIPTNSMAPTLDQGDHIYADLAAFHVRRPAAGEVVVLEAPAGGLVVKRVIAMGRDVIEGKDGRVMLNGEALLETYAVLSPGIGERNPLREFGPVRIPEDHFFVMGDNRDFSFDSRDPRFGLIGIERIRGKPLYVYWSKEWSRIGKKIE
jgi:signal peptidase I